MKITELDIQKLYGYINYNIKFNDNINFLYGENGCGKTTVLKIITNIITGRLYSLYKYGSSNIALYYTGDGINKRITVAQEENYISVSVNSDSKTITNERIAIQNNKFDDEDEEVDYYFSKYPVLYKIQNEFNYVFLPLNRTDSFLKYDNAHYLRGVYYREKRFMYNRRFINENDINMSIVNGLIKRANNDLNMKLSNINDRFNAQLLRSFLDAENIPSTEELLNYLDSISDRSIDLENVKLQYKNALTSINLTDEQAEKRIDTFFESLYNDISEYKDNKNKLTVNLLFKLSELKKITSIITKAEEIEQRKYRVRQPVENFTKTINLFFRGGFNEKNITIQPNGNIYIKNDYGKRITLEDLSSGEKQIITFFAYLVFGLEDTNQSIYLVDEPELSLHLNWQRIFVESIMNLKMDVQLIFATHSPEMIGKYRENAIKLIPRIEEKTNE